MGLFKIFDKKGQVVNEDRDDGYFNDDEVNQITTEIEPVGKWKIEPVEEND